MSRREATVLRVAPLGLSLGMLLAAPPGPAYAQGATAVAGVTAPAGKRRVLTPDARARWSDLYYVSLSADGQWTAYALNAPAHCDLVVRRTTDTPAYRVPSRRCPEGRFSDDSRYLVFTFQARDDTARGAAPSLGIMTLGTGALTT